MTEISVAKQIEMAKKYGKFKQADIEAIQRGDENADTLIGQLTVALANAIINMEVSLDDIEAVSAMVPDRFAVNKKHYKKALDIVS